MKGLSVIIAAFILLFGAVASRGANVDRISAETGIPVATLQAERASTGLGWADLRKRTCWLTRLGRASIPSQASSRAMKAGDKLHTTTG